MRARPAVAALVLLPAVALAGCAGIPERGPVLPGRAVKDQVRGVAQFFPSRPAPGATAEGVVRGFLNAAPDFSDDHEVAREFLATANRTWRPDQEVLVHAPGALVCFAPLARATSAEGAARPQPDPCPPPPPAPSPSPTASRSPSPSPSRSPSPSASLTRSPSVSPTVTPSPSATASPLPRAGDRRAVNVTVTVQATVDAQGILTLQPPGRTVTRTFLLVAEPAGDAVEWRIEDLDDGILLRSADFDNVFRAVPLYFSDPTGQALVPDVRWFPVAGTGSTPTLIVAALLAGPAPWLRGAVRTGAPAGTRLGDFGPVQIRDRTATIDLTRPARTADSYRVDLLRIQLRQTLQELARLSQELGRLTSWQVAEVALTVEGVPLAPPTPTPTTGGPDAGLPLVPAPQAYSLSGELVALDKEGRLGSLDLGGIAPVSPLPGLASLEVEGAQWPAAAIGSRSSYAVLTKRRTELLWAAPGVRRTAVQLLPGARRPGLGPLTPPSIDRQGYVWSTPTACDGTVLATATPQVRTQVVAAPWLRGAELVSLRVSSEGSRALVLSRRGGVTTLHVSAVLRADDGRPVGLGPGHLVLPDVVEADDVVWADNRRAVLLGSRRQLVGDVLKNSEEMPWVLQVGGDARGTSPVKTGDPVAVAAGTNGQPLFVQLSDGTTVTRSGVNWVPVSGVSWPASAG